MQDHVQRDTRRPTRAFTLIEVLVVLTIVGIAAAVVVPHMMDMGTTRIQAAARSIIADILYAQNDAIALQSPRSLVFDLTNNQYELTDDDGATLAAPARSGGLYQIDFSSDKRFTGVTLSSAAFDGGLALTFDALGSPSAGGQIDLAAGDTRYRISVAAFTGRVTITQLASGGS
jgi:type II secretion system protein H